MDIKANIIKHKNESRIAVQFPINNELNQRFKMIDGARWSRTLKVWHLPDNLENRIKFHIPQTEQKTINTNNKIIPSNTSSSTYQIKKKMQKAQSKTNMLTEKFGFNN